MADEDLDRHGIPERDEREKLERPTQSEPEPAGQTLRTSYHPSPDAQREQDIWRDGYERGRSASDDDGEDEGSNDDDKDEGEGEDEGGAREKVGGIVRRHPIIVAAVVILVIALIVGAVLWWLHARNYENTDDAFIDTRSVTISAQVAGAVTAVLVNDNQQVKKGDVLAKIDPRDYQSSLAQADAQIDQANASITNLQAQIEAQQASIDQAQKQVTESQAALTFSQQENSRYQELVKTGAGSAQRAQQAVSDLTQKQAALASSQAAVVAQQKQVQVLQAQKKSSQAQLESAQAQKAQAEANLSRAILTSPVDGRVANLSGAIGAYAAGGTALMTIVPNTVWVTANFKETQLDLMRPGQPVTIKIDAYPARHFNGHVDSIQAGSGTAFSLLPAENATGNYVKIVQRVPVKIVFDEAPDVELGPGMSVVPTVTVR
ncbi:membrane fusion protein, multidrug efflux system [Faunimonas pinastri]|uniref:Membrane fusion protein, multidrug efflux system n=1 Tax=Faunimonas pinastri TaxID=1855383 RepID=A0A1H9GTK1_9HYPH|nr:HlyD family secretion protein [Faunimonas pinastri]SEQ53412.1 membrane fusion protein, multidrug efflux system [Faunimonas pinastri]